MWSEQMLFFYDDIIILEMTILVLLNPSDFLRETSSNLMKRQAEVTNYFLSYYQKHFQTCRKMNVCLY